MSKIDTKEKILKVAGELFAKKGFGSTSIRDISQAAEVNLASINYHFKNKENLYWSVFDHNYDWVKEGVKNLSAKSQTTSDLAVNVFRFFLQEESALMNIFKIFLSDNITIPVEDISEEKAERFGPPGHEYFIEKINSEVDSEVSEESKYWAMKMSFSLIVHFGIILNTTLMKKKCQTQKDLTPEYMEKSLKMAVESHLDYIKRNPNLF